jgi:hypothetical protein
VSQVDDILRETEAKLFPPMRAKGHIPQHVEVIIGRAECATCGVYSVGQTVWGRLGTNNSWAELPVCFGRQFKVSKVRGA